MQPLISVTVSEIGSASSLARTVLTFAAIIALAAVAAHSRVRTLERSLGLTVFFASGFPFLLLGTFVSAAGAIPASALPDLQPAYVFGLGWIGFTVGMSFDIRRFSRLPGSLAPVILLFACVPMLLTALTAALTLGALGVARGAGLLRDVLILAACAAPSGSASLGRLLPRGNVGGRFIVAITRVDQVAALAVLALVAIAFRNDAGIVRWALPRSAWLIVTLGIGTLFGLLAYLLTLRIGRRSEEIAVLIGAVALAAGAASYLSISVPVVCAIAGALLVNLPLTEADRLRRILLDIERPLYLLFLFVVGTSWRPAEWQGWVLGALFALSRAYGKLIAARWSQKLGPPDLPDAPTLAVSLLPQSAFAIVVIFSAATLAGAPAGPVRWAINAVIIGSIVTDIFVQIVQRRLMPEKNGVAAT